MTDKQLHAIHDEDLEGIRTRVGDGIQVSEDILLAILKSLHRIEHQLNEPQSI